MNKKVKITTDLTIVDIYIFSIIFISILLIESLKNLFEIFTYGIYKKELLTKKSNLGFDLNIKIR
tara:strand:- start:4 stop:198 length:195 start_codon:yes stop_codon:yes gene_type:complete